MAIFDFKETTRCMIKGLTGVLIGGWLKIINIFQIPLAAQILFNKEDESINYEEECTGTTSTTTTVPCICKFLHFHSCLSTLHLANHCSLTDDIIYGKLAGYYLISSGR